MMTFQKFVDSLHHGRSSDDLIVAQYRSLRAQVPTMYLAILVNTLFLGSVGSRFLGLAAYYLPSAMAVIIAIRLVIWRTNERRGLLPLIATMRRSMIITIVAATGVALALSLWSQYILRYGDADARSYVALFAALCTICCAASLSSLPLAAYIVVAIGTISVSIAMLVTGDAVLVSMGTNILLVLPLVIGMVYRQHDQMRRTMEAHSEMASEKAKVSEMAYRDSLTRLANRRAFLNALATASASAPPPTLAVAIVDLDGFKIINDTYGHQTGDALLVETARRFRELDLGEAVVARLGGDEFAILLHAVAGPEDAWLRLASVAAMFEQAFTVGSQSFRLTASIGIADGATAAAAMLDLVKCADLAMYEAKGQEQIAVCLFTPAMAASSTRRSGIERALATHAENSLIRLCYQPIVHAATKRIVAFEALARWTHPTLGVIAPDEFVPLVEQAGKTAAMTDHLLSLALAEASAWPADIGLAFNLSASELGSPSLANRLLALIARTDFDPGRLTIEVTETALLTDFPTARAVLGDLRRGGVRIVLDDFGAGYSSIGYLREITFDAIKLDGSLIVALMDSPAAHDLLIGVLQLCRAIGAPVTAEMVETQVQYDLLCALGVQHLQGYFLSRPLTAERAMAACRDGVILHDTVKSTVVAFGHRRLEAMRAG